jgi:transposase
MAKTITFKRYEQDQAFLLPPSLVDLIPANHPVFTVGRIIDSLDIEPLLAKYRSNPKGGQHPYHPRMLLKVVVYGYVSNIYSSRKLEEACRESIYFRWLTGMQTPDHHTINRFRSERLKDVLKIVFSQVVLMLHDQGLLSLKEAFTDGTKIEANANRYTFVWARAIKVNREKIGAQLKQLWDYSQTVAQEERSDPTPTDFTPIDGQAVKETIEKINAALKDKPQASKEVKAKLRYAARHFPQAIDKYNEQEQILGQRASYSKTDPDATFMRMKEDHMKNGQLKPGYNLQISTSNQYITDYTLHSSPTDTLTLAPHLQSYKNLYGSAPHILVADAGYGSEQNLTMLESERIEAYVKPRDFDREQRRKAQSKAGRRGSKAEDKSPFVTDRLYYNEQQDCYICPMGQRMDKVGEQPQRTRAGHLHIVSRYKAKNCEGCPLRGVCHKGKGSRTIEISHTGRRLKEAATGRLSSEQGIALRKRRCCEPEPVFGNLKHNHGFRRFLLRGQPKVEVETGLHSLAHNLRKLTKERSKKAA